MSNQSPTGQALSRAGRRVAYHLIQAAVEGLKAVEAVIEEIGSISDQGQNEGPEESKRQRIEIE
ncbi:MAG: hypothetical protein ACLFRT_02810 [Actinomycetota bacterium]